MPRNVSEGYLARLQDSVLTSSLIVTITRSDGYQVGFTTADRAIVFDGVEHRYTEAVTLSAFQASAGEAVDNAEASGAVTDDRVTDEDLAAGLWDGAVFEAREVDRHDLSLGAMTTGYGYVGQVSTEDGKWRLELRDISQLLQQVVGDSTSPTCRCRRTGEPRCGVDMAAFRETLSVEGPVTPLSFRVAVAHAKVPPTWEEGEEPGVDWYERGIAQAVGGRNDGIEREIKTAVVSSGHTFIVLRTPFPFPVVAGDTMRLEAGDDRTIRTCRLKFGNANRFRGEPDLPTNDVYLKQGRPPG